MPRWDFGDFGDDEEAETEPALRPALTATKVRLEEAPLGVVTDGVALVGDADAELFVAAADGDFDGCARAAVLDGVGEQVREQLLDALRVAADGARDRDVCRDLAARVGRLNLGDDVAQTLAEIGDVRGVELDAAAQPATCEVHQVVDQRADAPGAAANALEHAPILVLRGAAQQDLRAGRDGGERVPDVVAQDRDELLAQLRGLALIVELYAVVLVALFRLELERDEFGEQAERGQVFPSSSFLGNGSRAHTFPKYSPLRRKMGTAM